MRKLLLCALLATPPACCATSPVLVPQKPDPCVIPVYVDPPPVSADACPNGTDVCIPMVDAVALSKWIANELELNRALSGCSLVVTK